MNEEKILKIKEEILEEVLESLMLNLKEPEFTIPISVFEEIKKIVKCEDSDLVCYDLRASFDRTFPEFPLIQYYHSSVKVFEALEIIKIRCEKFAELVEFGVKLATGEKIQIFTDEDFK